MLVEHGCPSHFADLMQRCAHGKVSVTLYPRSSPLAKAVVKYVTPKDEAQLNSGLPNTSSMGSSCHVAMVLRLFTKIHKLTRYFTPRGRPLRFQIDLLADLIRLNYKECNFDITGQLAFLPLEQNDFLSLGFFQNVRGIWGVFPVSPVKLTTTKKAVKEMFPGYSFQTGLRMYGHGVALGCTAFGATRVGQTLLDRFGDLGATLTEHQKEISLKKWTERNMFVISRTSIPLYQTARLDDYEYAKWIVDYAKGRSVVGPATLQVEGQLDVVKGYDSMQVCIGLIKEMKLLDDHRIENEFWELLLDIHYG